MSFLTRATVAAFFVFALLSAARAQAPVPTSTQATALPPDNDFNSVRESANQGFAPAQNQLGYMYQHKFGVPRDYKRAVAYYRSAAKQGYALGQYNVGGMFEDGVGVKHDYKTGH